MFKSIQKTSRFIIKFDILLKYLQLLPECFKVTESGLEQIQDFNTDSKLPGKYIVCRKYMKVLPWVRNCGELQVRYLHIPKELQQPLAKEPVERDLFHKDLRL